MTSVSGGPETAQSSVSRLHFDIDWPPKHAAAYLIEAPDPILIDAGDPTEHAETTMLEELDARGYEPGDLEAVVVTHPHSDHIGQVPLLRAAGVPVYAAEPVVEQLERDADDLTAGVRAIGRSAGLRGEALDRQAERARDSLARNRRLLAPDDVVTYSFDEPFSIAGREFEPLHTPGHQIHHASLETVIDGERVLFSGDVLIEPFRAAALHVGLDYGAYEAIDAFFESMDCLEGRPVDRVYPGHGPVFTAYENVVTETRTELESLVSETLEAVEDAGPATPVELTRYRIGESRHPAGLLDTLGAVGTLESRDIVAFERRKGARYYSET